MSRVITADFKDEAESLWRPYGIQIEWTGAGAGEAAARGFSLEAILARRIGEPGPWNGATVLGSAVIELNAPRIRPIRVSFDAIETVLTLRTNDRPPIARIAHDHELARALGRVLAHEIGHVLLAAPYHDEAGLMRAFFRANELADPNRALFRLTCNGVGRLRSRIRVMTGIEHEPLDRKMCIPSHPVR